MRGSSRPLMIAVAVLLVATPAGAVTRTQSERATVKIFAPRHSSLECGSVLPLTRVVQRPYVLTTAMRDLVAGPTPAERKRGYRGFFSATTANTLRRVVLKKGVAYIDFAAFSTLIPNASSSCGSIVLLAQLDHTARQFPAVKRAIYSFEGSRRAFYEWLQRPVRQAANLAAAIQPRPGFAWAPANRQDCGSGKTAPRKGKLWPGLRSTE